IEGDRHGEEGTINETKGRDNTVSLPCLAFLDKINLLQSSSPLVILLSHESLEGRETSVHDKFQIAKLPLSQSDISKLL
ncbi:hypothetical protein NQU36_27020, partial [Escherichia coli]